MLEVEEARKDGWSGMPETVLPFHLSRRLPLIRSCMSSMCDTLLLPSPFLLLSLVFSLERPLLPNTRLTFRALKTLKIEDGIGFKMEVETIMDFGSSRWAENERKNNQKSGSDRKSVKTVFHFNSGRQRFPVMR